MLRLFICQNVNILYFYLGNAAANALFRCSEDDDDVTSSMTPNRAM